MDLFKEETFRRDLVSLKWEPVTLGLTQIQLRASFPLMPDTRPHHRPSGSGPSVWLSLLHQCGHHMEHLGGGREGGGRRHVSPSQGSDDVTTGCILAPRNVAEALRPCRCRGAVPPSHHTNELSSPPLLQVTGPFHGCLRLCLEKQKKWLCLLPLVDITSAPDKGHVR